MDASFFLKGFVIGFSIAAPVGPIGLLCIQRTLNRGRLAGFVSGLGAASADGFYGIVASFGLTLVSQVLVAERACIQLVGGAFIVLLGVNIARKPAATRSAASAEGRLGWIYVSTLALTLANPMTIVLFIAFFASLGVGSAPDLVSSAGLSVAGVFSGSTAWWLILSTSVSLVRKRLNPEIQSWIGRIAGIAIAIFGSATILSSSLVVL